MPDASGINPNISLGIATPAMPQANPLGMLSTLSEVQNRLNQNRLFQQTFAARQRAGQILSQAPDLETGLANLMKDPVSAPFAGEIINQARSGMLAQTQMAGEIQKQSQTGLEAVLKGTSAAALGDPSTAMAAMNAQLAQLSPAARKNVEPAAQSFMKGILAGMPKVDKNDPASVDAARQYLTKQMAAMGVASGLSPENAYAILGVTPPAVQEVTLPSGATVKGVTGGIGGPSFKPLTLGAGAGAGGPIVSPTPQQVEEQKGLAAPVKDMAEEMSARSKDLPKQIYALDSLRSALTKAQAGGGANLRETAGQFLQFMKNAGVDIPEGLPDQVANHSLADSQYFQNVIKTIVTQQLSGDVRGQGRSMRPEVDAYIHSAGLENDPKAILRILNRMRNDMDIGFEQAKAWPSYRKMVDKKDPKVGDFGYGDYYTWWAKEKGIDTSPMVPGGEKGQAPVLGAGAAPKVTHKYVPGKGIVPVEEK